MGPRLPLSKLGTRDCAQCHFDSRRARLGSCNGTAQWGSYALVQDLDDNGSTCSPPAPDRNHRFDGAPVWGRSALRNMTTRWRTEVRIGIGLPAAVPGTDMTTLGQGGRQ